MNRLTASLLGTIAVVSITANVLQAKRWSNARPIVTVGGHSITRGEYMAAVDVQTDGSVLKNLVLRAVVMEAARRAGVLPTESQITEKMTEVQQRQPELLDTSSVGPAKVAQNRADIVAAIAMDNLRMAGIQVTDDEVSTYYARHAQDFMVPKQVKTTLVITNDPVNAATAERLLESGATPQDIAVQPGLQVAGINSTGIDMNDLAPALRTEIQNTVFMMKQGAVKTFYNGRAAYTYRVDTSRDAYVPPLADIRDAVARRVKLEKAPDVRTELGVVYKQVAPKFDVPKYAAYFSGIARSSNVTTASLP